MINQMSASFHSPLLLLLVLVLDKRFVLKPRFLLLSKPPPLAAVATLNYLLFSYPSEVSAFEQRQTDL